MAHTTEDIARAQMNDPMIMRQWRQRAHQRDLGAQRLKCTAKASDGLTSAAIQGTLGRPARRDCISAQRSFHGRSDLKSRDLLQQRQRRAGEISSKQPIRVALFSLWVEAASEACAAAHSHGRI
jgi:transposase-like protein